MLLKQILQSEFCKENILSSNKKPLQYQNTTITLFLSYGDQWFAKMNNGRLQSSSRSWFTRPWGKKRGKLRASYIKACKRVSVQYISLFLRNSKQWDLCLLAKPDRSVKFCKLWYSVYYYKFRYGLFLKSVTYFHKDILSSHLFLNTETLLLGEEPRFITLRLVN